MASKLIINISYKCISYKKKMVSKFASLVTNLDTNLDVGWAHLSHELCPLTF